VTVTVNYELQIYANELLRSWFRDPTGPTSAIAMVDNRSGAVKVMASGLEFGEDVASGQRPYDLATKGRRQAGSAFKPFALAAALESGAESGWAITLGTHWSKQSPIELECPYVCSSQGNTWTVRNFSPNSSGVQTLEEATISSTNTVFAQVALAVGPEKIAEMAHRMGIESPLNPVPSIVLGSQSVSPLEMAAAYSTLANFGERVESYLVERVEDREGNVIYQHETVRERVLNEALAAAEVAALEKVVSQGTATRARLATPRPQAGKTGTAQNFRDVWFMGFIPQYTTAVWVGHPDAQIAMENFKVYPPESDGQTIGRATGGTVAAPIWKVFMDHVTAELEIEDFPEEPSGTDVYRQVPLTEVPDISGLSLEQARQAIFAAGLFAAVVDVPSLEPEGTILGVSPPPGTTLEQGKTVSIRVSTGELVTMIDLTGLRVDKVDAALEEFNEATGAEATWVIRETETDDRREWGRVLRTRPAAGEAIDFGVEIVVVVGAPPTAENSFL
jgi:membrane peptidoglycan carboxypeptidase